MVSVKSTPTYLSVCFLMLNTAVDNKQVPMVIIQRHRANLSSCILDYYISEYLNVCVQCSYIATCNANEMTYVYSICYISIDRFNTEVTFVLSTRMKRLIFGNHLNPVMLVYIGKLLLHSLR